MLTQQRHEIILKLLKEKGSITVTEVRDLLDTSESTVRRDITALDKEGKLEKVFGGAVEAGQKVTAHEYTVAQKNELNCDAKQKIAEYAASLIEPDDFVFLDAGTTTAQRQLWATLLPSPLSPVWKSAPCSLTLSTLWCPAA